MIKGQGSSSRKYRDCPIETCRAKVKYLSQHLKVCHEEREDQAVKLSKN